MSKSETQFRQKMLIEQMYALNFTLSEMEAGTGIKFYNASREILKNQKKSSKYSAIESFVLF